MPAAGERHVAIAKRHERAFLAAVKKLGFSARSNVIAPVELLLRLQRIKSGDKNLEAAYSRCYVAKNRPQPHGGRRAGKSGQRAVD